MDAAVALDRTVERILALKRSGFWQSAAASRFWPASQSLHRPVQGLVNG
jgi:hypothetical protein